MKDIHKIFDRYVGSEIKDPDRMACDCDPVADPIVAEARKHHLQLVFEKAGSQQEYPPKAVHAHIELAGNNRWTITSFTQG